MTEVGHTVALEFRRLTKARGIQRVLQAAESLLHWFHGMRASIIPIPQVSVIPAKTRPEPINAESPTNAG